MRDVQPANTCGPWCDPLVWVRDHGGAAYDRKAKGASVLRAAASQQCARAARYERIPWYPLYVPHGGGHPR
eukprot:1079566-Prymnesium_polylepis.1